MKGFPMFALVALLCFVLALFHVHLGSVDLVVLGFAFVALHLLFGGHVWGPDRLIHRG
jgi:hypothetical protein